MRTYQQWQAYKQLELITDFESCQRSPTLSIQLCLQKIWQWFCIHLSASKEPRVWEMLDRSGQAYWKIYDPLGDRWWQFDSAEAVTAWIEERHRQSRSADWQW
jgi:hypothetical protein